MGLFELERALVRVALVLLLLLAAESSWLVTRILWRRWKHGLQTQLEAETSALLFDAPDEVSKRFGPRALGWRGVVLRDHLTVLGARMRGEQLQRLQALYRGLGFLERDRRAIRERSGPGVARRMVTMAPRELAVLPLKLDQLSQPLRLMVLMGIGSSTPAVRVVELLSSHPEVDELQSHPVDIAIGRLCEIQLQALMEVRDRFRCQVVAALVLQESCLKIPERRREWMGAAFGSDRPALRRTACEIARHSLSIDDAHELMLAAYDPTPEVQAAALAALGALRDWEAEEVLLDGLGSEVHQVRLAAALAMKQLGPESVEGMWQLRDGHPDPRVREVVGMVLDAEG